ncbi:MAG TPA: hypothetical protein VD905_13005 [Flavobacteriales bacterium]|nr:hypothetical protein [Flavobacteriales bacterium]
MTLKRKIIYFGVVAVLGVGVYAYYEYTRKPATASELSTDFKMTAEELRTAYDNEEAANKKYLDKIIEVSGTVDAVSENNKAWDVSLATSDPMTLITVQLMPEEGKNASKLKPGDKVTLKGICNGKVSDVELNKGTIITN